MGRLTPIRKLTKLMTTQKDYAGIDYGLGMSNTDKETGIRYGLIGQNAETLNHDATEDIFQFGKNVSFETYVDEFKLKLRSAMEDYFSSSKWSGEKKSKLDQAVDNAFDAVEQDVSDNYQSDNDCYLYEKDGYKIHTTESELWVTLSPFYTHAQFCSPCAPGAGNLDSPCADGPKTYCLGHDWFEDCKAPYPVYSVADGKEVLP